MDVTEEALEEYLKYLKKNIKYPCWLIASQEFSWEEYYTFGPGSKKEYERLKKNQPSYKDKFDLLGFEEEPYLDEGILVNVKRISDKKRLTFPLENLEATDKKFKTIN